MKKYVQIIGTVLALVLGTPALSGCETSDFLGPDKPKPPVTAAPDMGQLNRLQDTRLGKALKTLGYTPVLVVTSDKDTTVYYTVCDEDDKYNNTACSANLNKHASTKDRPNLVFKNSKITTLVVKIKKGFLHAKLPDGLIFESLSAADQKSFLAKAKARIVDAYSTASKKEQLITDIRFGTRPIGVMTKLLSSSTSTNT